MNLSRPLTVPVAMSILFRHLVLLMLALGLVAEGLASASPRCAHASAIARHQPAAAHAGHHGHHHAAAQAVPVAAAEADAPAGGHPADGLCRCRDGCAMPGCTLAAPALAASLLPARLPRLGDAPQAATPGAERAPHGSPPIRPPSRC